MVAAGAWCAAWWPTRQVEVSTLRTDAGRRDLHLLPRWADVELIDITRQDVRAWAALLRVDADGKPLYRWQGSAPMEEALRSDVDLQEQVRAAVFAALVDPETQRDLTEDDVDAKGAALAHDPV